MKKGKWLKIFICAVCLAALGITYAAADNTVSLVQRFGTGKVDIKLQQLTLASGKLEPAGTGIIAANEKISYIPRIINKKGDCYIRAKVELGIGESGDIVFSPNDIYGLGEGWVKRGEYFYYQQIMEEGQRVDVFEGIHIPENWKAAGVQNFSVRVRAEAIQSSNFTPDFSRELPWGAVELEDSESQTANVHPLADVTYLKCYPGTGFQCSTEDLFSEYKDMMPADTFRKKMELKNMSDVPLETYMNISSSGEGLSGKLNLKVSGKEGILYEGTIEDVCKIEQLELPGLARKETGEVTLEITFPKDAGNEYSGLKDDMIWTISAAAADKAEEAVIRTGDDSNIKILAVIAILAAVAVCCVLFVRRKGNE